MKYSRRSFFSEASRSLVAELARTVDGVVSGLSESPQGETEPRRTWVRPPGALEENRFRSACTRCTDCLEACPYDAIRRLGPEFGIDAGTPAIIVDKTPCYLCEDTPCITSCDTGALVPTDRFGIQMGLARINYDTCYVTHKQPCDYCVTSCPLKAHAIGIDEAGLPHIYEGACTGCGVCSYLCPADAITIHDHTATKGIQK